MKTYLIIDIGNSMIDCFYFIKDTSQNYFFTVPVKEKNKSLLTYIREINDEKCTTDVYISSVNSFGLKALLKDFEEDNSYTIHILDKKIMDAYCSKHMFTVTNTDILGGDLFADLVGSNAANQTNEMIADFGTATKMMVINSNKEAIGGVIFPGVYACSSILSSNTDLLEREDLELPPELVSLKTDEAINSAATYGTAVMIYNYAKEVRAKYKLNNAKLIITGGAGAIIVSALHKLGYKDFKYDRFRIIRGIANAFELNSKLKGTLLYEKL